MVKKKHAAPGIELISCISALDALNEFDARPVLYQEILNRKAKWLFYTYRISEGDFRKTPDGLVSDYYRAFQ